VTFAGDATVRALPAGTVRVLNLMVRGGDPDLRCVEVDGRWEAPADALALVALSPGLSSLGRSLRPCDAVVTGGTASAVRGRGTVAVARLS